MPSERSSASAMTGEKAEREKATSISLQTCCRPAWITARVSGSRLMAPLWGIPPREGRAETGASALARVGRNQRGATRGSGLPPHPARACRRESPSPRGEGWTALPVPDRGSCRASDGDAQVADGVEARRGAGLDDRGCIELLDHGR